jgi:hypothetical protein
MASTHLFTRPTVVALASFLKTDILRYCLSYGGHMRTVAAVVSLFLLVPLQAKAQSVELTLNCEYESSYDLKTNLTERTSGGFSAIVQMQTLKDGTTNATIQATTIYCFNFLGSFGDLEVAGDCERTLGDSKRVKASLRINRINGEFDNTTIVGNYWKQLTGHCTPAKKLF